jgi:hypothetical protein
MTYLAGNELNGDIRIDYKMKIKFDPVDRTAHFWQQFKHEGN